MRVVRRTWTLLRRTIDLFLSRYAFQHAGALAFYTLFSMAPLLIILITVAGAVWGEEAARGEISKQIEGLVGPQAALAVEGAVSRSRIAEAGLLPTILGIGALIFGSTTVFAQLQTSLNQFWGVAARPSRSGLVVFFMTRLASLGVVIVIGFLLLTSFVVTTALQALVRFARDWIPVPGLVVAGLDTAISLGVTTVLFAMIFKILPDVRLHWRDMWRGAIVTALLFVGGQSLISLYLTRAAPASSYGAAGSLVLVLMWVYYSSLILFFGAALTRAMIWQRGERVVPKPTAVRVKTEIVEEQDEAV
jgi:membrane protein